MPDRPASPATAEVRAYWNHRIHDLEISSHPAGSPGFFADLDEYHFDKLHHLLELVDFDGHGGRRVLDVGCGTGVDLVRFVRGGAVATGVDVADAAIALARENLRHQSLAASLCVGDGEGLPFPDNTFDFVYAHGGWKGALDNHLFVGTFNAIPKPLVRRFGWHLLAFCRR